MNKHLQAALQKQVVKTALIGIAVILLATLTFRCMAEPYVFLGLDGNVHANRVCYDNAVNDISANLGFGYTLIQKEAWELNAQYSHLSCAFDHDQDTYDGAGIMLRWYPGRW